MMDPRAAPKGLYPHLLGPAWNDLAPAVQRAHADAPVSHAEAMLTVRHGTGRLVWCLLRLAGVPGAAEAAQVKLWVQRLGRVERWHRTFAGLPLVTLQREAPGGLMLERFGPLELLNRLQVQDGRLVYAQVGAALRLGRLRLPLPRWLAPQVAGEEGPGGMPNQTRIVVRVSAPTGGLLFSYTGIVRWRDD